MPQESGKKRNRLLRYSICFFGAIIFLLGICFSSISAGEPYPNRPIRLIIGYAPGGSSDLAGKFMASKLEEFVGQPIVPEYKPGGGGTLGASYVAKARPDGYTVFLFLSFMNLPPEIQKIDYSLQDFRFIGIWNEVPNFWVVKADSQWKNLKEFVEDARKNPGKLTTGFGGANSGGHFTGMLLEKHAGIKLTHVPFKSCGEAWTAMLGGHISAYVCPGIGEMKGPLTRTLATFSKERLKGLPDVPTAEDFGWPVYFSTMYSFAFPKGTPDEVIKRWTDAQRKAREKYAKEIVEGLADINMWPYYCDPAESIKEFESQYKAIQEIVKK